MVVARTPSCSPRPTRSTPASAATAARPMSRRPGPRERSSSSWTGRCPSTSTRPTISSSPSRAFAHPMSPDAGAAGPAESTGRVEVIGLDGIPEIRPGDDLGRLIGDAIERSSGLLPLRSNDVVVVTQKVVSKAEGAVVDLTTIEPRPEATEFATRWDRDPRQVEVVLREARRVVRMEHGVLITETPHGFICANGGVDASNVGPASGNVVTLLPADPDAS